MPMVYLASVWDLLPQSVPTHFGLDGKANGYSSKTSLPWLLLFLGALPILLKYLLKIDPAKQSQLNQATLQKIRLGIAVLTAFIGNLVVHSGVDNSLVLSKLLTPIMLIFMAFLGNYMGNLKPNYFAGVRTPWTLASETVWRKTHQLASKLMFGLCLAALLPVVFLPMPYDLLLASVAILISAFYPIYYSYRIFKEEQNQ